MLYPMFFMVLLAFIVGCVAIKIRVSSVKDRKVSIKYFKLMEGENIPEMITKSTRNFNNQFEVPTLFYVVCSLYLMFEVESTVAFVFAWLFVGLRYLHSYIHLTYNHMLHRVVSFWAAYLCVMVLWVNLLIQKM